MRFTWHSNAPWARTGYGNQTELFVPRFIKDLGHEVAIIAYYGLRGSILHWNGMQVYPGAYHNWGCDIAAASTVHFKAGLTITLMDAWIYEPQLVQPLVKWVPWFPVDTEPLAPPVKRKVEQAFHRIVFSKFGERMVHEAGLDCDYVPLGVDTNLFKPMDKREAREKLGWPQDRFIVGMVGVNQGHPNRKAWPSHIDAFAEFKKRHPDAWFYLHTNVDEQSKGGANITALLEKNAFAKEDYAVCDQFSNLLGFPPDHLVAAYNAMDVHILVSMGEGFGLPILEAQACGTPVIVGDWTAMNELCFDGWKVPRSEAEPMWIPLLGSYQFQPRVGAIVDALELAYRTSGSRGQEARNGAMRYDADRVTQNYWKPVLEKIESMRELADG